MLKILIIDDEAPTREWIEFCIKGSSVPCEIVGLASTGQEGVALFEEHLPGLVFTDIEMPGMNGIELLRQIKVLAPSTHVIILTCHKDFSFARDAMRLDASEYILKTEISKQSITELLTKYQEIIRRQQEQDRPESELRFRQSVFFHRLLSRQGAQPEVTRELCREHGLPLKDRELFAVALRDMPANDPSRRERIVVKQHPAIENSTLVVLDQRTYVLIANVGNVPSYLIMMQQVYDYARAIHRESSFSLGVSKIYHGVKHMVEAVRDALFQLEHEFYSGSGSLNSGFAVPRESADGKAQLLALFEELAGKIEGKDPDTIRLGMQMLLGRLSELRYHDIGFVKDQYCLLLGRLCAVFGAAPEQARDTEQRVRGISYLPELHNELLLWLEETARGLAAGHKKLSGYIGVVVAYIGENYSRPVTLAELAKQVNLNTDYLSRLFKEEMGCNFVAYLTRVRLEQAVRLLTQTDNRVYEIAEAVGYPNLSYFSRIFKKHYGVNPFEYRSTHNQG